MTMKLEENQRNNKLNTWIKLKIKYMTLLTKLRKMKFNKEKITINFFIFLAFLSIIVGLVIFMIFMIKLSNEYSISGDSIVLEKTGQVGDFVGGIVGAIWALTGVLLFYATLRLQSKELAENRKHFQMGRLTDIIYKQLDLFNAQLTYLTLKDIERDDNKMHIEHKGRAALLLIRNRVESILKNKNEDKEKEQKALLLFMGESFAFIEINKNNLLNLYEELENHVSVIRAILIKEDIPPADLNELKSIFFKNIGIDFLNTSQILGQFLESYITYREKFRNEDKEIFSIESSIKRKISVIEEFRNKRYDKQTIKDYLNSRELYNDSSF